VEDPGTWSLRGGGYVVPRRDLSFISTHYIKMTHVSRHVHVDPGYMREARVRRNLAGIEAELYAECRNMYATTNCVYGICCTSEDVGDVFE